MSLVLDCNRTSIGSNLICDLSLVAAFSSILSIIIFVSKWWELKILNVPLRSYGWRCINDDTARMVSVPVEQENIYKVCASSAYKLFSSFQQAPPITFPSKCNQIKLRIDKVSLPCARVGLFIDAHKLVFPSLPRRETGASCSFLRNPICFRMIIIHLKSSSIYT